MFGSLLSRGSRQLQGHYGRTARDLIEAGYVLGPEATEGAES